MARLRIEKSGVWQGGAACRVVSVDNVPVGDICRANSDGRGKPSKLWCVDVYGAKAAPIDMRDRCHIGLSAALAFAKRHFGGGS